MISGLNLNETVGHYYESLKNQTRQPQKKTSPAKLVPYSKVI
jgi:hypothetical protein